MLSTYAGILVDIVELIPEQTQFQALDFLGFRAQGPL